MEKIEELYKKIPETFTFSKKNVIITLLAAVFAGIAIGITIAPKNKVVIIETDEDFDEED